jgi:hypothetical protein
MCDGQTAPYACCFRPDPPCRCGPLDLAIETASNQKARLDALGSRIIVHRERRQWRHNVAPVAAFHCNQHKGESKRKVCIHQFEPILNSTAFQTGRESRTSPSVCAKATRSALPNDREEENLKRDFCRFSNDARH